MYIIKKEKLEEKNVEKKGIFHLKGGGGGIFMLS